MSYFKSSFYNRTVEHHGDTLLYNGKTGALFRLTSTLMSEMRSLLGPARSLKAGVGYTEWSPVKFSHSAVSEEMKGIWSTLVDAGVFIPHDFDERAQLKREFVDGKSASPFMVSVTTTLDCNMRCYYCFQNEQESGGMSLSVCDEIDTWIKSEISAKGHRRMFMEWYGGEPMLNREVIERLSASVIPFCDEAGVSYKASMLCNGTLWPADVDGFLERTRMTRVQFSLDGPKRFHNKRRGLLNENSRGRQASFDEVIETVGAVVGKVTVGFRINVDSMIGESCLELVDLMAERGWLKPGNKFYPYIAMINDMTEHCGFIGKSDAYLKFKQEFPDLKKSFFEKVGRHRGKAALDKAEYYPRRRLINCSAVNENSIMFGPNGMMYKCGLDVGDHHRSHGSLAKNPPLEVNKAPGKPQLPVDRWQAYDPFTHTTCKECQYLPMCLGGCPRVQMDKSESQIRAQSEHFEKNFENSVREYADAPL